MSRIEHHRYRCPAPPRAWFGVLWLLVWLAVAAPAEVKYQRPPQVISDILAVPGLPAVLLDPTRERMLLYQTDLYPSVADLAEPMLRLAGQRINPLNNGPHRTARCLSLTVKTIATGKEKKLALPGHSRFSLPVWSPDGTQFALLRYGSREVELWVGDAATGVARRLKPVVISAAHGEAFVWLPDSQTILCQTIPANREPPPVAPKVPVGPTVQENLGKLSPARTYTDLLENAHDEDLFQYYATAQVALVNVKSAQVTPIGKVGIYAGFEPSPDGQHLLISRLHRPFSYTLPASSFPREVEVWDRAGKVEHKVASLPLAEEVPIGGVRPGPRSYHWRPTAPATLVWVEALDDGDPKKRVPYRDHVLMLKAPFKDAPVELAKTEHRFGALSWGEKNWVVLLREVQSSRRWTRTWLLNPDTPEIPPQLIWDQSTQERYKDPGSPMMRTLRTGHRAMRLHGNSIYLSSQGATPDGDRPFLDRFDLTTLKAERLFQCEEFVYEHVIALTADDAATLITRRESPTNAPNYFLVTASNLTHRAMTEFPDPAPQLRGIRKQLVTYQRADGVPLSFTLYLPPDYQPGQRLPTVLWAYPREFSDADLAGQISGSPNRFTTILGASHLFLLTQGYVILDGTTLPVIGDPKTANNTYLEQIVAGAKAAIDKAVELGVTDPNRVGVGGHSYGAFMTANLLAHSDLFRAGIARSGAYNRTLTPFGFQSERRTLWEAPEVYLKLSPLMFADKIKEPLLLIHGEADNNPGTFPTQSERLFQAMKGHGGTARLVMLPHEAHSYEARESVEHVLHEMIAWFDKYVKNAPARTATTANP